MSTEPLGYAKSPSQPPPLSHEVDSTVLSPAAPTDDQHYPPAEFEVPSPKITLEKTENRSCGCYIYDLVLEGREVVGRVKKDNVNGQKNFAIEPDIFVQRSYSNLPQNESPQDPHLNTFLSAVARQVVRPIAEDFIKKFNDVPQTEVCHDELG